MKLRALRAIATGIVFGSVFAGNVAAAGTSTLTLSPNSGSYVQGSGFTVQVRENGTDVNVVTAKLSYDAANLTCNSVGASSTFTLTVEASCANGKITISRSVAPGSPAVSGTQTVGTINFTVLGKTGTTSVTFDSNSQIVSNGVNTWNGATAGGTYTMTAPAVVTPPATPPATPTTPPATPGTPPAPVAPTTQTSTTKKTATQAAVVTPVSTPTPTPQVAGAETTTKTDDKEITTPAAITSTVDETDAKSKSNAWILGGIAIIAVTAGAMYWTQRNAKPVQAAVIAAPVVAAAKKKAAPKKKVAAKKTTSKAKAAPKTAKKTTTKAKAKKA